MTAGGGLDAKAAVNGLDRCQMVHPRTDAADAGDNAGDLLGRAADDKLFKAAQRRDGHPGITHLPGCIKMQVNTGMPLDAGDRMDGDDLGSGCHGH